jgi:hypothetical protein
MQLRDELSELIRDRLAWVTTTISISLPAVITLLLYIRQSPEMFYISTYFFFVLFIIINSVYILIAKKTKADILIANTKSLVGIRDSKYEERTVARYPLLQPYAQLGILICIIVTIILGFVPPVKRTVQHAIYGTPTLTPSLTPTLTPSSTVTLTPRPKPISDSLYYMIVYDSSIKMDESFHGQKKWEVARNLLVEIINGLNPRAQYSLITIGGPDSSSNPDPCGDPEALALPFSPRQIAYNYFGSLQPQGGGSFYKAYTLAKNQLEDLPKETIRTLIYITGSSDTCESQDEWTALKNLISFPDSTFGIFSQIIILDEDGIRSKTLADQFNSLSSNNINAQAPQSISEIQSGGVTVTHIVNNMTTYVTNVIATLPTDIPTRTPSPIPGVISSATVANILSNPPTNTFTPIPPTFTPTWTPSITPSVTPIPLAFVELQLPVNYLTTGIGCQIDVKVSISGSSAAGAFHVRNGYFAPGESAVYPQTNLPIGTYYAGTVDVNNLLTLGGDQPEYYQHEIWFEYDGRESNHLTGVTCPGVP